MLLLYFMDGVKYDMMKAHMPFLSSLNSLPLLSELGYSCACHATMYTGRYVEEHGTWFIWKRGGNSPYRWINRIPGLKYINLLPLKLIIGKLTNKLSGNTAYVGVPSLVNLPLKYWPLFEPCDDVLWDDPNYKTEIPNLFSILREHHIKHDIVALHKNTGPDDAFLEEISVNYKGNEFVYYFIGYTDNIMHAYGENSEEARDYFKKVDNFVRETYEKATREHDDVTVIAFSDHGHIDLENPKIDINVFFRERGLNVNAYINLIEFNYARFWCRNDKEREDIHGVLKNMESQNLGFILTQEHYDKYHLNLPLEEHGEIVFYLGPPREFTNTIWRSSKGLKSGHGYEPGIQKHHGIFCCSRPLAQDKKFIHLVDILPTVMDQLRIPKDDCVLRGSNIVDMSN